MEVLTVVELAPEGEEVVSEFEALLGPFDVLLGPFELPYPVDADRLPEADPEPPPEALEVGTSEDPDAVPCVEDTGTEAPEEVCEILVVDVNPELGSEDEELTGAEEAEFGTLVLDRAVPSEDDDDPTVLSALDGGLGRKLEPPVTDAELSVDIKDELMGGLVLRLGKLRDPDNDADPDPGADAGAVPVVIDDRGLLLTGIAGVVVPVPGAEVSGVPVELGPLKGGTVADDDSPGEIPGDEDGPPEEDGGVPGSEGEDCPEVTKLELTYGPLGEGIV